MIKTNKKKLLYKKKLNKTRKNMKKNKKGKNIKNIRRFFGGAGEDEIPFLLKQSFENRGKYLPPELLELILKDVPKESIRNALMMADYKKSHTERNEKIETLKKIYPELLEKYKKIIEEKKIQIQKIDSIRTTRRTSYDVIKKNAEIISKLHREIDQLYYNINRLNKISEDFEKIKNIDLNYFLTKS